MKKFIACLSIFLMVATVVFSQASGEQASEQSKPALEFLEIYSGSSGGSWYNIGAEIALILEDNIQGLTARTAPGGGTANPGIIQKKQGLVGLVYTGPEYEAINGVGNFKENPAPDLCHVMSLYSMPFLWFSLRSSDINSVYDMYNKRISPGRTGQSGLQVATECLTVHGIALDDITKNGGTVSLLGDSERMSMLRDRNLDVASGMLPLNHSELQSLSINPGIKLISMDPKKIPELQKKIPGLSQLVIPAGKFDENQKEDVYTVASVTALVCHKDLDADFVYQMCKAIYNNQERLVKYFTADDNVMGTPLAGMEEGVPVHPGAMKFYKEIGLVK